MAQVSIAVVKGLSWNANEPPMAGEVVGRISSVGAVGDGVAPAPGTITLPVGNGDRQRSVNLPIGRYAVDAFLPSGDLVTKEFSVDSDEPQQVYLLIEHSAHEWLSWQHLAGNVPAASQFRARLGRLELDAAVPRDGWPAWVVSEQARPIAEGLMTELPALAAGDRKPLAEFPDCSQQAPGVGRYSDGPYSAYEFTPSHTIEGRRYAVVEDGSGGAVLAVLPVPWQRIDETEAETEIDVLVGPSPVGRRPGEPAQPDCSIVVRDPVMTTVLSYLRAGDNPAAHAVLAHAREMLFWKSRNAIAAAAGGYILLANWPAMAPDSEERSPAWLDWIANLFRWFEWLPDGAIQLAWLKLLGVNPKGRPRFESPAPRELALEACRRGIPYYTAGVRMLQDCLDLLANRAREYGPDPELEAALTATRELALQVEPWQPFTTLRLTRPRGDQGRAYTGPT